MTSGLADFRRAAPLTLLLVLAGCAGAPVKTPPPQPAPPPVQPPAQPGPAPTDPLQVPDAVPRDEPRAARGNPAFYEALGQRYYVLGTAAGYVERGVASWYGPTFHGESTATGERYDMYAMTAAHRTLPLPAYVRVTNLANGKSVVVRVNDRGPFKNNRIIDLSYSAAARLDMIKQGTALVQVEALGGGTATTPPVATGQLYVQVGSFGDRANAERLVERLASAGLGSAEIRTADLGQRQTHRVYVGPATSVEAFDALLARLRGAGFPDARVALD